MRTALCLSAYVALSGCWYGTAKPASPARATVGETECESGSYRAATIVVDAVGVAAATAGLIGLSTGRDEDVSGGLLSVGMGVAAFGAPIIHLAHGRAGRAGGSYGMRAMSATMGMLVGYAAGCNANREDWLCGFEGMLWGTMGGLAVGATLDAVLLHDDSAERPAFSPTVSHGDGITRVGIAGAF